MTLNSWGSNSGGLRGVEYPFITVSAISTQTQTASTYKGQGSPFGIVVNMLGCVILISKLELESSYSVHI